MNKHISVWILNVLRDSLLQSGTRVHQEFGPLTHVAFSLALADSALLLAGVQASAQCPATTLTSGLQIPLGVTQSNQGNLLVSETGTFARNTGRISIVGLNGTRRTLLDGLPSGLNDVNEQRYGLGVLASRGVLLRGFVEELLVVSVSDIG